jgi:hypothetical protein
LTEELPMSYPIKYITTDVFLFNGIVDRCKYK